MNIDKQRIRSWRLRAHHLDGLYPSEAILDIAGTCGLQNSPPGAWENALFNRIENCSTSMLHEELYERKRLLQAWSYRGVPVVFPTEQSSVFLSALAARKNESWIYTRGITLALAFMQMSFDDLFSLVKDAVKHLDGHVIKSKETLDKTLAAIVCEKLPKRKQKPWNAPSMYGNPEKHAVGEAVVSFMLRPCSFLSLVVFGKREGVSPTFTSLKNWVGRLPKADPEADKKLIRKFLHCYGPTTVNCFATWLGCSDTQARRLWKTVADEIEPVQIEGKPNFMLTEDMKDFSTIRATEPRLILLGAYDPYLDQRDRTVVLDDKSLHKIVWKTTANPGAVVKGGRIIGTWKSKTVKTKLDISLNVWESVDAREKRCLENLAEKWAAFENSVSKATPLIFRRSFFLLTINQDSLTTITNLL